MSKNKGKRGEREAAAELGVVFGVDARRGVQYQGGPDSPDVVLDGVPVHVEAKRTERLALWAALDQATSDAPAGSVPVVWHRCNRRASILILETRHARAFAEAIMRGKDAHQGSKFDAWRAIAQDASSVQASTNGSQGAS